jgi:hypothetical protein
LLREGYPRVVESKSITGLKAGYHVVLLGFCPAEEAARQLELFRALDAEVYTRPVDGPEDACPLVEKPWIVSAPRKVKAGEHNTLSVATFYVGDPGSAKLVTDLSPEAWYQARQSTDAVAEPGFAVAVLRGAEGEVIEQRTLGNRCYAMEAVRVDGTRLRVKGRCVTGDGASDICGEKGIWEMTWILEAEEAIAVQERRGALLPKVLCR